jgi:hypothetical protein
MCTYSFFRTDSEAVPAPTPGTDSYTTRAGVLGQCARVGCLTNTLVISVLGVGWVWAALLCGDGGAAGTWLRLRFCLSGLVQRTWGLQGVVAGRGESLGLKRHQDKGGGIQIAFQLSFLSCMLAWFSESFSSSKLGRAVKCGVVVQLSVACLALACSGLLLCHSCSIVVEGSVRLRLTVGHGQ